VSDVYAFSASYLTANQRWVHPDAMVALPPAVVAAELGVDEPTYLALADGWSRGMGLMYGITVDQVAGTVTRA